MKTTKILLINCCIALISSCTYDSEDDLVATEGDGGENPSTTLVTYENTIKAIVDSNCITCHSSPPRNGAPFALVNFSQVSARANLIQNAISRQSGAAGAMPPAGRLPQTTIDAFEEWIENGTPEN